MPPRKRKKPHDIDREIRISELRHEIEKVAGKLDESQVTEDCPPEVEEQFLRSMLEYEKAGSTTNAKRLEEAGVSLPVPESLTDAQLHEKLWEVIRALAARHVYLEPTNHLSDRELYEYFVKKGFNNEIPDLAPSSGWNYNIDMLGECSEEDLQLQMKFYASEKRRREWKRDWPDFEMPEHVDPPYDRDRLLPQPVYAGIPARKTVAPRRPKTRGDRRSEASGRNSPRRRHAPRRSSSRRRG